MLPFSEIILLFLVPAALIAAAGWDLASYTIPNTIPVALLACFAIFVVTAGMPAASLGMHVLAGALGLGLGFALFAFGFTGGGDAKLFAAIALWLGLSDFLSFALLASIFGGVLTLAIVTFRSMPMPSALLAQSWIMRLHDRQSGIPYGVALAAGACAILPYTDVFRAALAS